MRGFIRIRTLLWLAAFTAVGVVGLAYGRAGILYYRIDQEARELANAQVAGLLSEKDAVTRFIASVDRRTKLTLERDAILVERDRQENSVTVQIRVDLPVHFLIIDKTIYRPTLVKAKQIRLSEY
jgi:hypothetical protein